MSRRAPEFSKSDFFRVVTAQRIDPRPDRAIRQWYCNGRDLHLGQAFILSLDRFSARSPVKDPRFSREPHSGPIRSILRVLRRIRAELTGKFLRATR